jgi:hypothetical protein
MPPISAKQFLEQFARAVQLPVGYVIALREDAPKVDGDPNWIAATGNLPREALVRYESALIELRRQYPILDWEGVTEREGKWRRIVL